MATDLNTPYPIMQWQLLADYMEYVEPKSIKHITNPETREVFKFNANHHLIMMFLIKKLPPYLYDSKYDSRAGLCLPKQAITTINAPIKHLSQKTGKDLRTIRTVLFELSDSSFPLADSNQQRAQKVNAGLFSCGEHFDGEPISYQLHLDRILLLLGRSYKKGYHFLKMLEQTKQEAEGKMAVKEETVDDLIQEFGTQFTTIGIGDV